LHSGRVGPAEGPGRPIGFACFCRCCSRGPGATRRCRRPLPPRRSGPAAAARVRARRWSWSPPDASSWARPAADRRGTPRNTEEGPQHGVAVQHPFALGRCEAYGNLGLSLARTL